MFTLFFRYVFSPPHVFLPFPLPHVSLCPRRFLLLFGLLVGVFARSSSSPSLSSRFLSSSASLSCSPPFPRCHRCVFVRQRSDSPTTLVWPGWPPSQAVEAPNGAQVGSSQVVRPSWSRLEALCSPARNPEGAPINRNRLPETPLDAVATCHEQRRCSRQVGVAWSGGIRAPLGQLVEPVRHDIACCSRAVGRNGNIAAWYSIVMHVTPEARAELSKNLREELRGQSGGRVTQNYTAGRPVATVLARRACATNPYVCPWACT